MTSIIDKALSALGLMRVSEHEDAHADLKRRLGDAETSRDDFEARFKKAVADLEKQAGEIARLKADFDLTPWKHCVGDPPDYESPLGCVYDSGVTYAYARLADWLGVTDYEMGDGSEDYATDVGRTGANVLVAAGFVNDDGDLLSTAELAALKADALLWRNARDKRAKKRGGK